ncbi:thioredoxin [Patellaria atrata CBS 101060]|uniref:Thioredoxin n=1 Tax=Patellaria atrata CBS 101060 TaxID=1346257 RepID=A0A9P4SAA2_9PEZI|nr:thioredoxin [Patellaria atrata CBS 101060]
MDVQLYVYDLSRGLARQLSMQFLGIQIDAVYHTSIVFGGVEYFFGAGVQTCYPGTTHHGKPVEIIPLGQTVLPIDVILEYLESLKTIYTAESYDLFMHNCNNFTNDFTMFLVGKGIPERITSLPQTVLNTPFGQMLRPQLDRSLRTVTQAPVPTSQIPSIVARTAQAQVQRNGTSPMSPVLAASKPTVGEVHNVTSSTELKSLLDSASNSCAVIFFTSATCAPCRPLYAPYSHLAAEAGSNCTFIKVDVHGAPAIGREYSITATPTFITFLNGTKEEQWSGADEARLAGTIRMLIHSAHPSHPHTKLHVPHLLRAASRPVTYAKLPPLDKLVAKMGDLGSSPAVRSMQHFILARNQRGVAEAPLPDLPAFSSFLHSITTQLPLETQFTALDLLRIALVDVRVSGFYAEETPGDAGKGTIEHLLEHVNGLKECPYNLRLVALHLACNLFTSPLSRTAFLTSQTASSSLVQLATTSLLDSAHSNVRVAAASLALNLAMANHRARVEKKTELLAEEQQVELAASVIETIGLEEESKEAVKGLVMALGFLVFCAPVQGELLDLCRAMDAQGTVRKKEGLADCEVVKEVARTALGKGL